MKLVLVATVAGFVTPARADALGIADEGRPLAVIVVPDTPGDTEKLAAGELQSYLEKITGATLPVKPERARGDAAFISVGRTRLSETARERLAGELPDAFIVEAAENGILLAGGGGSGRSPGTLFAVYDFLERDLGCRWLGPGGLWEHVPRRSVLNVSPESRLERPSFRYRQCTAFSASHRWSLKNKANMGSGVGLQLDFLTERVRARPEPPFDMPGWSSWHSGPRLILPVGGRNPDLMLRRRLMATHPEWMPLQRDGSRAHEWLCHSNPELNDLLADRLSQMLRERPGMDYVQLGEGDGYAPCRCEACAEVAAEGSGAHETHRRGWYSYRWRVWENRVAGLLAETDPDKKLMGVAYGGGQEPLDPDIIRPADNVMMEYTTWDGCRMHGFEYDGTERHIRNRGWIESWAGMTPAGVLMSEYHSRASMYGISGPMPGRFVRDMRFLRGQGVVGYRVITGPREWSLFTINRYAALKAAWNPDLDVDELVRDYCDHAFHEASGAMQDFIGTFEAGFASGGCGNSRINWSAEVSAEARRHLDAAHEAAAGNELVKQRLVPWELHFQHAVLVLPARNKLLGSRYRWGKFRDADAGTRVDALREGLEEMQVAADYGEEMRARYAEIMSRPDMRLVDYVLGVPRSQYLAKGSGYRQALASLEKRLEQD